MSKAIQMKVLGLPQLKNDVARYGDRALQAMAAALKKEAELIMTDSKSNYVPVDTGNLRDSGYVAEPKIGGTHATVELGYGGAAAGYALFVHENPRAGKTQGLSPKGRPYKSWSQIGEWKFLETPFKAALSGMPQRIASYMKSHVGGKR